MDIELEIADIAGFPGYTIRSDGKVYKHGVEKTVSCKIGRSAKVIIRIDRKMFTLGLATLIANAFIPNPNKFHHIIFKDKNHHNCHRNNIAWVDKQTFFYYCCKGNIKRGRPKIHIDRNVAIQNCNDENLRNYYISLNDEWLAEAWKEIDLDLSRFDYWLKIKSEVYIYFIDRVKRYSILCRPSAILHFYARGQYITLKKTISPYLPFRKLLQTDESMRILGQNEYD